MKYLLEIIYFRGKKKKDLCNPWKGEEDYYNVRLLLIVPSRINYHFLHFVNDEEPAGRITVSNKQYAA